MLQTKTDSSTLSAYCCSSVYAIRTQSYCVVKPIVDTHKVRQLIKSLKQLRYQNWPSQLMCVCFIIAGPHLNMHPPHASCMAGPSQPSVLLFLTEFNEHIWSEDKRGWRDGAKRRRGEWGASGVWCGEAEDEDLQPSIINIPHEECQLLQSKANPYFPWPLTPVGLNPEAH